LIVTTLNRYASDWSRQISRVSQLSALVVIIPPRPSIRSAEVKPGRAVTATYFKTHCLELLEEVARTRQRLVVTRHGKPIAEIRPHVAPAMPIDVLKGSILHQDDLVSPAAGTWESTN
jgi:prevent-host-death family protein